MSEHDDRVKKTLREIEDLIAERDALKDPLVRLGLYDASDLNPDMVRERSFDPRLRAVEDKNVEIARKRDEYMVLLLASTRASLKEIASSMSLLGKETVRLNRSTILLLVSTGILVAVSTVDFLMRLGVLSL